MELSIKSVENEQAGMNRMQWNVTSSLFKRTCLNDGMESVESEWAEPLS